jgi:hypothetical protein
MLGHRLYPLNAEVTVSFLLVAFAAAELYAALRLPMTEEFTLGPGALPSIYAVGLLLFSVTLFVRSVRKAPASKAAAATHGGEAPGEVTDVKAGLISVALLTLFIAAIYLVGFMISLILFCFLFCLFVSKLGLVKSIVFALIWGGAVFMAFDYLLQIPLESGLLFS